MQVAAQQVSPGEYFNLFYFLRNHTDAATYYIQARIYDVATDELLATHNLTQSAINSRLFTKSVLAPGDQAGYGRSIVSIATVYTDSGYSSKSPDYEEQEQYFLVKPLPFVGGGGGISARDAREIVSEELEKALKTLPKPEKLSVVPDAPDMSFVDGLFGALGALQREVNRIPKDAPDLQPLISQFKTFRGELAARPQFERTDLSSLAEAVQNALDAIEDVGKAVRLGNAQLIQAQSSKLDQLRTALAAELGAKVEETIQAQEITLPLSMTLKNSKKKDADAPTDVRHLTG